jgi:FHA domain
MTFNRFLPLALILLLASTSLFIHVPAVTASAPAPGTATPTPTSTPLPQQGQQPVPVSEPTAGSEDEQASFPLLPMTAVILILAGLSLVATGVVIALVLMVKKRRQEGENDARWKESMKGELVGEAPPRVEISEPDPFIPSKEALGVLIVLDCEDPFLRGQRFEINRPLTTLGRSSSNDLIFPLERAVSRQHAVLEARQGQIYLREVGGASGHQKPPVHGTFLNERRIESAMPLHSGDRVRLGKQFVVRFEGMDRFYGMDAGDQDAAKG